MSQSPINEHKKKMLLGLHGLRSHVCRPWPGRYSTQRTEVSLCWNLIEDCMDEYGGRREIELHVRSMVVVGINLFFCFFLRCDTDTRVFICNTPTPLSK